MSRARLAAAFAAVLAAAIALQASGLGAPFFADDWLFLDATRGRGLLAALTAPDPIGNFARPVGRQLWFWILDRLGGGESSVFHAANLVLWLTALGLFAWLTRRLAGARPALVAVAIAALTHAADVPVRWAAGSQDLLAITFALGSLLALERGARLFSAALFLTGLFAKETVAGLPLIALLLLRRPREPWSMSAGRIIPLIVSVCVWALVVSRLATGRSLRSGVLTDPLAGFGAASVAFARTLLGAESAGAMGASWLEPVAIASIVAVALAILLGPAGDESAAPAPLRDSGGAGFAGIAWILAGVAPVAFVAPIWSAYYFLFAMLGAALAIAALLERVPRAVAALAVVALGLGAQHARALPGFARQQNAWSTASHVNRTYLEQGGAQVASLLREMKQLHPTLAPGTTVFFAGLPAWVSFQVGDGPLLRVAYRDTSLRSYFLVDFTRERADRGPWRFIYREAATGRLLDQTSDPLILGSTAVSMLVRDQDSAVDGALALDEARGTQPASGRYLMAWRLWARGERAEAARRLQAEGFAHSPGADAVVSQALQALAVGDTASALAALQRGRRVHILDAGVHGMLADLWLASPTLRGNGVFEAYAARVLAPEFPFGWRRWATVQLAYGHRAEAARSLERYFALAPSAASADPEAVTARAGLRELAPEHGP